MVFSAYISVWVVQAEMIGLWNQALLKDTCLWFVLSGIPLVLRFNQASEDQDFFRRSIVTTLEVSVILGFFFNVVSFGLLAELILQPFIALLLFGVALSETKQQYASQKRFWETVLSITITVLTIATARSIYEQRELFDMDLLSRSLALTFWLTIVSLPFIYAIALYAGYELIFMRMTPGGESKPPIATRAAVVFGLNGRLWELHKFSVPWVDQVRRTATFREALERVREFRRHLAMELAAEAERQNKLVRFAGVRGTDAEGRQLDQREFEATKQDLRWLAVCQMGWHRNRGGRYRPELLSILGNFETHGLKGNQSIVLEVSHDGQSWYAWRRTITNRVFAIGAAKAPPDEWLYDGPNPPTGFPGEDASWGERFSASVSRNW